MKIRFAQKSDVARVMELGKAMVAESRFSHLGVNEKKMLAAIEGTLSHPTSACLLLADDSNGNTVGMLAGFATEYFFCDGIVVQDRAFYVAPERRGSSAAVKLLIAFRRWAESRNANELNINMSVAIDMARFNRLMTHMGFKCCGSNFSLPLVQNSQ